MLKNSRLKRNNKELLDLTSQMLVNNSQNNKSSQLHKMPVKPKNNNLKEKLDNLALEQILYSKDCRTPKIETF